MLEKTPKNSLRVPFLAAAFPDAVLRVPLPRPARDDQQHARRLEFGTVRHVPEARRAGTGHRGRCCSCPAGASSSGTPLARDRDRAVGDRHRRRCSTTSRRWTRTAGASRATTGSSADPPRRDRAPRRVRRPRLRTSTLVGPAARCRGTRSIRPHPEKWRRNADELEPHWDGVEAVAARAHAVFAAPPPRRVRCAPPPTHSRAAAAATVAPASRAEPDADGPSIPQRAHHEPSASMLQATAAARCSSPRTRAGRVIIVRADGGRLNTHFRGFPSPDGRRAPAAACLAVGTKTQVHVFQNQPAVIARLEDAGSHDACFVPRRSHTTGDVRIHDLALRRATSSGS